MIPGLILVCAGIFAVWRPVETHASTSALLAVAFLGLVPWVWRRTSAKGARRSAGLIFVWLTFFVAGQAGGWDRSEAIAQAFLAGAVMAAIWVASRIPPDGWMIDIFALGLIGLAIWGLWQSLGGLEHLRILTDNLPEHLRAGALARIERGRAFASLFLPSHLAVVLAMALPLLMVHINRSVKGILFSVAFSVGLLGLLATRSPVGVLLAVGSCGFVVFASRRRSLYWTLGIGLVAVVVVVGFRPDVVRLEPIALRLDNWGSAMWVWSTAPVVGVGLGGFGQASQAVPWLVGNHPVHAHSMPLELLADLGLFGLVVWIGATAWLLGVVRKLWPDRPDFAAALLVVPVHNLVDFSLYTSAVALPWAVVCGWSLALTGQGSKAEEPVSPALRWIPVLAGTAALGVGLLALTGHILDDAARSQAPFGSRLEWAQRAAMLAVWDADATDLVAILALESGRPEIARDSLSFLETRRWQRPRSAARAQLMARLSALAGDPVRGVADLWRAQEAQPHESRRRLDFETAVEDMEGRRHGSR